MTDAAISARAPAASPSGPAEQRYILRPGRHGLFLVNPRDRFVGRSVAHYGEFSEMEAAALARLLSPGAVVVEAGANMGALTVPLARAVGPDGAVFAWEPQRLAFQLLCANAALNGLTNVVAFWAALGAARGVARVPVLDPDAENNIGGLAIQGHAEGEEVAIEPLDALDLPRLDLLKADVEGMECEVLAGARETIRRRRPILYLENDRAPRRAALIAAVRALGYRAWWHRPPLFNPDNHAGRPDDLWRAEDGVAYVSINMLCLPEESPLRIDGLAPVEAAS